MSDFQPSNSRALPTAIDRPGLISFWDFQEPAGQPRVARGPHSYALTEASASGAPSIGRIAVEGAPFGPHAAELKRGEWFRIARADCPALDLHGPEAQVSIVAWLQRYRKPEIECEAIAGMWNETEKKRQYCLFLDLRIHGSNDNVGGHVSATGGPSIGHPWCMDAAIGKSYLTYFDWHCVAFTYDGHAARVWLDGQLDHRLGFNPYAYPYGLYDGGAAGADFTVGAVYRGGSMGNWFTGRLGGLAVYSRALDSAEMGALCQLFPAPPAPSPTKHPNLG